MAINNTLKDLGFNDKEIKVYLGLLENGKATPSHLSKLTKINRATVYNIAKGLQSKGVIAEDLGGKTLYFTSLPVQNLEQIVKRPIRELQEKESVVKKAIEELSLLAVGKEYPVPRIRFVEENNLENFLYENIGVWMEDLLNTDSIWWGIQDYSFLEHYGKFNDWYWKQPYSKEAKMYLVGNESEAEREALKKIPDPNRDVRFSDEMKFTSSIWVGGDYLIMIVTRQHPFYLVEIHDKMLALNMREVFKRLWMESKSNKIDNQ
jgi:sugar-specific transcriptional regulator TrmB